MLSRLSPETRSLLPLAAAAFLVSALLALLAQATAGDEEVAHYQIARYSFRHPDLFLSLQGRPLVTLMLSIPAQAGFLAARLASALATGLTAFAVARVARSAGWSPPAAVLLLLLQPYFLAHAGTAMTEPWAALLLALALLAFVEKRAVLLASSLSLAATARPELVLLLPLAAGVLILWKRYRALLLLPAALVVWNLGGFLASGDPLWLLHQVDPREYPVREPLHYVKAFVWIVGLGCFVPMVAGIFRSPPRSSPARRAWAASLVVTVGLFFIYTYLATWRPLTYGNFRYLAFGAAPLALLGTAGLSFLQRHRRPLAGIALALALAGSLTMWGHSVFAGSDILGRRSWAVPIVAALWILWFVIPGRRLAPAVLLIVLAGGFGLIRDHAGTLHLRNSPEQDGVARAAELLRPEFRERTAIHSTHPLLSFYAGGDPYHPARWPRVHNSLARDAAAGTVWFWDSHYTPNLGLLTTEPGWRYLGGVIASDTTWAGAFFERTSNESPADSDLLARPGVDRDTWFAAAHLVEAGAGYALRAAEEDPTNPVRWQVLADRLGAAGRFPEAWAALDRAERLRPGDATTYAVRAFLLYSEERLEEALTAVESAVAGRPAEPYFRFQKGQILWELGRKEEARPWILEAVGQLPDRWEAQLLAADVHFRDEDFREAARRYGLALQLKPDHLRARAQAARCREMLRSPGDPGN